MTFAVNAHVRMATIINGNVNFNTFTGLYPPAAKQTAASPEPEGNPSAK